jgi:hypothetical protein
VQGAGCAAWRLAEVEGEQVEGFPRLEGICVCVNGVEIESPKAGLVGDAWSVLYPVGIAVAVAEAVVAVGTAGLRTDRWARCFATAGHLVYWEMVAYGKMIELTSGRWKEIWWVNGGCVLVRLPPRRTWPVLTLSASLFALHVRVLRSFDGPAGSGACGQKKTVLDPQRAFGTLNCFCGVG